MSGQINCKQCGFTATDSNVKFCPRCGAKFEKQKDVQQKQENSVDLLILSIIEANIPQLIQTVANISGLATREIGPKLHNLPFKVCSGVPQKQAEEYLKKLRATGALAEVLAAENAAIHISSEEESAIKMEAEAEVKANSKTILDEIEAKARETVERIKAQADTDIEKADAAKAQAEAEIQKLSAEKVKLESESAEIAKAKAEAEARLAEAKAKADAEAAALAAEQAKIKAAELEKIRLETEARKAEAEIAKAAEIARAQEEARLAAEKAAEEEARRLARERGLAETTVVCGKCGVRYDKNMKFCPECGKANESLNPGSFICSKCGKEASSSEKICQSCGGTVVKGDPQWLQNMLELQKTIPYPAKKVCDVNIKPGYLSAVALSEYMEKHLGYFFEKVEVENGLIFTGRTAIKTPASAEEIRQGNPRTKKNLGGDFLSLYFRINLNKNGNPENYSLYLKTKYSAEHTPFITKLLTLIIGCPLALVFTPLVMLLSDSIAEVVLETINFSNIPNSSTGKLKFKKQKTYAFLALYLGFLGAHDFYAGKKWKGIVHFLLTIPLGIFLIPAGISLLWAWWEFVSGNDASTTVETV